MPSHGEALGVLPAQVSPVFPCPAVLLPALSHDHQPAAGMPGLLGEIEAAAVTWEETGNNTTACPPRIVQKARWMHQHLQLVYSLLRLLTTFYPDRFGSLEPRILSFRSALQVECVLEDLRTTLGLLQALPRPVGFAVPQLGGIPP